MAGQYPIDRQTLNQTTREKIKKRCAVKILKDKRPNPPPPIFQTEPYKKEF